jgi:uncharacterized membrane protein YphA (DoxX/SURF4 family)
MNDHPGPIRRIDQTGVPLAVARLVLGCMFIYMGWNKAWAPEVFLKHIRLYGMIPDSAYLLLNTVAVTLPWVEILCGVLLLLGVFIRGSALALLVMLVGFTIAIYMRARGIMAAEGIGLCSVAFDCGCGTGPEKMCIKLPENVILMLLSGLALLSRSRRFCLEGAGTAARSQVQPGADPA